MTSVPRTSSWVSFTSGRHRVRSAPQRRLRCVPAYRKVARARSQVHNLFSPKETANVREHTLRHVCKLGRRKGSVLTGRAQKQTP